ncbi:MAG: efflux transporter periplasmic adaptor subunit [Bacteroidetes bacterium MedPE-SWsnd-G2]|nr:MAG: efflux transporter periplasmic adaptor subunit [Bacteroidetes bacterium MedPE-SWsnd-G2]
MNNFKTINYKIMCLLAVILVSSCSEKKVEEKKAIRPVKFETVSYLGGEKVRTFSGAAKTDKIINLSFRNSGIITKLDMKLGQKVKKGQLLAQLDNVQSRLNYESSIESLNSAESQMNTSKLNLNRVRSLYEKGSSALSDYEAAKNSYLTAVASFESAKRSVAIQQEQIRYGYLYAPENSVIAEVSTEIDENVSVGQVIGVLNAGTQMEIKLGLPESVINGVSQNMAVKVDFSAIKGEQFEGVVTEVSPAVDTNTSTYPIKITVTNPSSKIKSGMAANVTFDFGDNNDFEKFLVVPAKAVGEDDKGQFVFVIEGEGEIGKVKKTHIQLGNLSSDGFEVKSGLEKGQRIATAGLQTLLDGQEVKLN